MLFKSLFCGIKRSGLGPTWSEQQTRTQTCTTVHQCNLHLSLLRQEVGPLEEENVKDEVCANLEGSWVMELEGN